MKLSDEDIVKLREVLRLSIGDYADQFNNQEINELGVTLLQTTASLLKTRFIKTKRIR